MRFAICLAGAALVMASCATPDRSAERVGWTLEDATFFPADRSLIHAEDGVVLPDGRLLVGDQAHGLVTLAADGTRRPFGDFAAAGFRTRPAPNWGSPNGISLEPDQRHILIADITTGGIYRAETQSGAVTRIYDHVFGVNTAVRDSHGAIWFTQSTENPEGAESEARMFAAIEGLSDGALFRIAPDQVGRANPVAERKLSGLAFANGIAIDERRGQIYVAETMGNRILALPVNVRTGALGARRVLSEIVTPDNLELDGDGALWVASPIGNEVLVIDPVTGRARSVFRPTPEASAALVAELRRRQAAGEPILPLLGPEAHGPMPGILTGIILSPGGGPVYVSGLGPALVRLDRQAGDH
jgi:sugar lactone lactonase YvrE